MQQVWWVPAIALLGLCLGGLMDRWATRLVGTEPCRFGRWLTGPLMACALVLLFLMNGLQWLTLCYGALSCLLLCVALCDSRSFTIPNMLVLTGILWALLSCFALPLLAGEGFPGVGHQLLSSLASALGITLPVFLLALIMERLRGRTALGGGDIKLLFMLGLFFPLPLGILGLLLSCVLGVPLALVPWQVQDRPEGILTKPIPFGIALSLAFYLLMAFGHCLSFAWVLGG